jgi:hypothetical protein
MRRLKRSTALLQRSRNCSRLRSVAYRARLYENKIARAGSPDYESGPSGRRRRRRVSMVPEPGSRLFRRAGRTKNCQILAS